jgi:hypothetical protein
VEQKRDRLGEELEEKHQRWLVPFASGWQLNHLDKALAIAKSNGVVGPPPLAYEIKRNQESMPYKDPEKQRDADRRWRAANLEKVREANRGWREANPEKQREATRRWHEANPEYGRKQSRRWREANLEKARAREAAYRAANREARRTYMAAYKASQKDARRLHAREATFGPDPRRCRGSLLAELSTRRGPIAPSRADEWSPGVGYED